MLVSLISRAAVAVAYVAGLVVSGSVDLLAATAGAAAVVAWLARPMIQAFGRKRTAWTPPQRHSSA
jgi:hypothetical protein